jgi:hypothetical protein
MNRVKEVVGYAYNNNMYVVINIHHDQWLNLSSANFDEMVAEYEAVWAQIADEFKYYDEKLIFESMNEVRYNEDWYGQTDEILNNYNTLNQSFYNLVRASGGLNDERYLMMETYAAQFSSHQLNAFWIPSAATDNHIIASVHMYNNSMTESTYTPNLQAIYNKFIANGIPCIIGETGIPSAWTSEAACANWATFFLGQCNEYGIKCFLWDDHGNYTMMYRTSLTWKYPTFVEAIETATSPAEIDPLLDTDGDRLIDNQLYGELTGAEIFAKGYSQPNGFKAKTVLQTYDDTVPGATDTSITEYSVSQSTTSGTSYDGGSMHYTSTTDGREIPVFSSTQTLDGRGFCFWYQSATAVEFTLKTSAGTVLNFGTLAASTSGKWVTVYYSGATSGLTYDSASTTTNYQSYVDNDEMLTFNIVSTSTTFSCYIDEFFTFDAE